MHKLMIFFLACSLSLVVRGSHQVSGTVTDAGDGAPMPGINVVIKGTTLGTTSDLKGHYYITVPNENSILVFSFIGMQTQEVFVGQQTVIDVAMESDSQELSEVVVRGYSTKRKHRTSFLKRAFSGRVASVSVQDGAASPSLGYYHPMNESAPVHNTEGYSAIHENGFKKSTDQPLSTFSIDVDAASYSNMRRFLNYGSMPPKDAVRIEEMINYFSYDYEQPKGKDPFSINTEIARAPWNEDHLLVQVGLQGEKIATENLPASNLVFLVDVSGSMSDPNKLPLLKASLKMLVNELRPEDRVAIVVYAGAAGLVLPSTSGENKPKIMQALDNLSAGGSTAGGEGIKLAYKTALQHFVQDGNNRVIIATDGDFNVGESSNAAMERLIEEKRKGGVFLTVLGYGMGNYKDDKMEILADKGNGNYAYIDNIREAKKVLVNEFGGTLFTIAKDVKIQVEFNPSKVQAYRLIGYENRMLEAEDFNDDKKDAGELGSGHTVTALYEVIPVGIKSQFVKKVDPLKYQKEVPNTTEANTNEWLTVKFRYKQPNGISSKLMVSTLEGEAGPMTDNLKWASAVTGFGMLLRDSEFSGDLTYQQVESLAREAIGTDEFGYRRELIDLVQTAQKLDATLRVSSK